MLLAFLMSNPLAWICGLALQVIAYAGVLRKMQLPVRDCFIPALAEWRLSTVLFSRRRSFWRPFLIAVIVIVAGFYINPFRGSGAPKAKLLIDCGIIVYGFMLARLYYRLARCFGKHLPYTLLMLVVPPLGVGILGYGKAVYRGAPEFKPLIKRGKVFNFLATSFVVLISGAEILAILGLVVILTLRSHAPRWFVNMRLNDVLEKTDVVVGGDSVITREDSMGDSYGKLASMTPSRDKFFPDHSGDKSVVVLEYIVGSNLEDQMGLASANIRQMLTATKQGSGLTFVLQCGGAERWFTKGIADGTYGRYAVHDGKLQKVYDLPDYTCMSEGTELADFLLWAKENYPADRYMLALWDHGGGFGTGFGADDVNKRNSEIRMIASDEIVQAIADSGITFDVIGFDACLMQTIELATQFEPYADYYLASEETEGGFGWDYTSAFGMLAANPGMSSEDFGREMIACYDPYNEIIDEKVNTASTLSFVDLTMVKPVYEQLEELFGEARQAIATDSGNYANLSLSGTKSYTFSNYEQVDLVDFLTVLKSLDYDEGVYPAEQLDALVEATKACVVYRNAASAAGINGIALTFPASSLRNYKYDYNQLKAFSMDSQKSFYNDFFSIMLAQRIKAGQEAKDEGDLLGTLNGLVESSYTNEEWYVEGFEDYETQEALIDIPLIEAEDGYDIELPEKAWDIIADQLLIVYERTDDGFLRYLGKDRLAQFDEHGYGRVAFDGIWVSVGGQPVCYEDDSYRETDEGVVFTATTKAILNDELRVILHIEWDPVSADTDESLKGHITGYDIIMNENPLLQLLGEQLTTALNGKAMAELEPGDRLQFLFDYYDEEGNLVTTEPYGDTVTITKGENLSVEYAKLPKGDNVVFGGVLIDVYQRVMTTEKIEAQVS